MRRLIHSCKYSSSKLRKKYNLDRIRGADGTFATDRIRVAHLRLMEPLLCLWSSLGDLFWWSLECFANLFVPMVACRSSGEPLVDPWALWGGWESPGVGRCVPRTCFVDDFCFSWGWRGPGPKPKPFKF